MDDFESFDSLPYSDAMMMIGFCTLAPAIATLPHCICPLSDITVATILDVVAAKGGIWGKLPEYKENGEFYLPDWEPNPNDFVMWEFPPNQHLVHRGGFSAPNQMIINSRTPSPILAKTYLWEPSDFQRPGFLEFSEQVMLWINNLKWAIVPLEGEIDYDIFVTSQDHAQWAIEVRNRLQAKGLEAFSLTAAQGRYHWIPADKGNEQASGRQGPE